MRLWWGILGVPLLNGCSFMFMHAPPDNHPQLRYFDCVSSKAAPATDAVNAVFIGLGAAVTDSDEDASSAPVVFGSIAALYAVSAIYGYVGAAKCDSAKQSLADRIHQREAEDARRIEDLERRLQSTRVCSSDADCKGDRICVSGACNEPAPRADPSPLTPEVVPESAPVP